MDNLRNVKLEIIVECREDYVGLWSIIRRVRNVGISSDSIVMETTLQLLLQLLSCEKLVAGQIHSENFEIWKSSPQEIISRIKDEWIALGRSPNIGEIAWFTCKGNTGLI